MRSELEEPCRINPLEGGVVESPQLVTVLQDTPRSSLVLNDTA